MASEEESDSDIDTNTTNKEEDSKFKFGLIVMMCVIYLAVYYFCLIKMMNFLYECMFPNESSNLHFMHVL